MLPFSTKYYAHRGLHGAHSEAPENSMEAFRRAVDAGYGMELDVQLSGDGQVVVFHDDTLTRVTGHSGFVSDYTYEELLQFPLYDSPERIPLFSDVLALVDGRTPLIVELKAPGNRFSRELCEKVAAMLDVYSGEFCIESFHAMYVFWFRRNRPHFYRGQLCTDFFRTEAKGTRWQFFLVETMASNFFTQPDFIAYDHHYRHAFFFRLWKRKITSVAWTIRSRKELEACQNDFEFYIMERVASS